MSNTQSQRHTSRGKEKREKSPSTKNGREGETARHRERERDRLAERPQGSLEGQGLEECESP